MMLQFLYNAAESDIGSSNHQQPGHCTQGLQATRCNMKGVVT